MDLFFLWMWLRVDALQNALQIVVFLCGIGFIASLMFVIVENRPDKAWIPKTAATAAVLVSALAVCLPSSRDIAIMVAYSYGKDLAQSEIGQKAQRVLLGKANEILDQELGKLKR